MPEHEAGGAVFHQRSNRIRARGVGKMPVVRQNTPFKVVRIRPVFKHTDVVVGFKHHKIRAGERVTNGVCHHARVGRNGDFATVLFKRHQ
jgi:hypothetical protein